MTGKDIVLRINAITNKDEVEALGKVLDDVLGAYEDNVQLLAQYNQQLNETSANIKALNKAQQEQGGLSAKQQARYAELIKQERELKQGKSELQIVMKNQEKIMQSENGSMKQQSLILGQLRMLYRNLTDEQKAALPQLKTAIDGLDSSLKKADADIGNFQRNVGNYPQLMGQIVAQIPGLNQVVGAFSGISQAGTAAMGVVGIFGAAVMGAKKVVDAYNSAIDSSASLTYEMRDAMVEADAATDVLTRRLQQTSGWFITVKSGLSSLWGWMKKQFFFEIEVRIASLGEFITRLAEGKIKEAFAAFVEVPLRLENEYQAAQQEIEGIISQINTKQIELDKLKERSVVRLAQIEAAAAEEQLKARDKERYSAEERIEAARAYEALIKERTAILKQQAILERDIAVLEGERSDNTHEVNMAIEEAKAKLLQLEKQETDALRRVAEVRGTVSAQIAKQQEAYEKALKNASIVIPVKIKVSKININDILNELKALQEEIDAELAGVEPMRGGGTSPLAVMLGVSDDELKTIKGKALQAAQQIYSSIEQMSQQATQRRLDNELSAIEDKTESEKNIAQSKYDKGLISETEYKRKLDKIDEQAELKREAAQEEAFERQKRWNISNALMNTALAVTNILATNNGGATARAIEVAFALATGAAQTAAIAAQKYARGGELHGASHSQGGIKGNVQGHNIELEGDEVVINKRSARKYRKTLSWINSDNGWGVDFAGVRGGGGYMPQLKYARGGVLGSYDFSPAAVPQSSSMQRSIAKQAERTEELIAATNRRIDRLQVQVNISDIEGASDTKQVHINRATLG